MLNIKKYKGKDIEYAINRHLYIEDKNLLYCFSAKTGCSTVKLWMLRMLNYNLEGVSLINIHKLANNEFRLKNIDELNLNKITSFFIIREPLKRIISCFYDKFVKNDIDHLESYARNFINKWLSIETQSEYMSLTFDTFVKGLEAQPIKRMNPHWRPQTDCLLLDEYTHVEPIENIETLLSNLNRICSTNTPIVKLAPHGRNEFLNICNAWKIPVKSILELKGKGLSPFEENFINDEILNILSKKYNRDKQLYDKVTRVPSRI